MTFIVVLDACVLFPNTLRDTVLTLAHNRLFRPAWSSEILVEVRRNVIAKRNADPAAVDRTLKRMSLIFEGAEVSGWEPLVPGLTLPDACDRHVPAAAIAGHAPSIVTFNLSDFPAEQLDPHAIEALHPQEFLLDLLDLAPREVMEALMTQIARYRRPPMDLSDLLNCLDRAGISSFTDEVRRIAL